MKKYFLLFAILTNFCKIITAQTSGEILYSIFIVDTIHNTVETNDSVQKRFAYNSNDAFWETKYNGKLNEKTILKPAEINYVSRIDGNLNVVTKQNDTIISESDILNYDDTAYIYVKNLQTKTILARTCKNVIMIPKANVNFPIQIWYDDSISCNSVILGAGSITKNVRGIILEINVYTPFGKNKMVATSLNFGSVDIRDFSPPPTN